MFGQGLLKGLGITIRRAVSRPITELYPYEHKTVVPGSRTFLAMHVNEAGDPACRACNTCVAGCPDHALRMVKDPDAPRRAIEFTVNSGRCCFCGLCVESCPYDALYFTGDYERATPDRSTLIYKLIDNGASTHAGTMGHAGEPSEIAHPPAPRAAERGAAAAPAGPGEGGESR